MVRALDAFAAGAAKYPSVARAASVLPEDLDHIAALRAALVSADAAQESTKVARKQPVRERVETQIRVESATSAIVSAGLIAFAGQPLKSAKYKALIPSRAKRAAKPVA